MKTLRNEIVIPRQSEIEGFGLTVNQRTESDTILGISHIEDARFDDGWARTYLGALVNHSELPNTDYESSGQLGSRILYLVTTKIIQPNEELVVTYGKVRRLSNI